MRVLISSLAVLCSMAAKISLFSSSRPLSVRARVMSWGVRYHLWRMQDCSSFQGRMGVISLRLWAATMKSRSFLAAEGVRGAVNQYEALQHISHIQNPQ